jgi:hypothetical protein
LRLVFDLLNHRQDSLSFSCCAITRKLKIIPKVAAASADKRIARDRFSPDERRRDRHAARQHFIRVFNHAVFEPGFARTFGQSIDRFRSTGKGIFRFRQRSSCCFSSASQIF